MAKIPRNKLVQLIHVAKRELDLDEDIYREVLVQITGNNSLKQMTDAQLQAVLDRFKQSGFSIKSKTGVNNLASDAQSKLIRHLWLMLSDAGEVRNSSELALSAFVKKQTGIDALQFLSTASADQVINRLRQWCKRANIERIDP